MTLLSVCFYGGTWSCSPAVFVSSSEVKSLWFLRFDDINQSIWTEGFVKKCSSVRVSSCQVGVWFEVDWPDSSERLLRWRARWWERTRCFCLWTRRKRSMTVSSRSRSVFEHHLSVDNRISSRETINCNWNNKLLYASLLLCCVSISRTP